MNESDHEFPALPAQVFRDLSAEEHDVLRAVGLCGSDGAELVAACDENPETVREQQYRHRVPGYRPRDAARYSISRMAATSSLIFR